MIVIDEFVATRRARWARLEALLGRAQRGSSGLAAEELEELGRLYRQATSDLAIARRDFPEDRVGRYLGQLVGRAHPVVYQPEAGTGRALREFFTGGLPRAFREAGPYTAVAFVLFTLPFVVAFAATLLDPLAGRTILPESALVDQIERGQSWLNIPEARRPFTASFIMTNNIWVATLAFVGGVLLGLGTIYVLVHNGLVLGAIAGLATVHGLGGALGDFVAAHGGVELTVVFVAGGAGLRIGHAIVSPGLRPRRSALAAATRRAIRLLFGCVPLLVIAGLIEGFVSPSALPTWAKVAVGVGATLLLYAYLLLAGRRS